MGQEEAQERATETSGRDAGFGLIELIVSMLVIGIVMTLGVAAFQHFRKIAHDTGPQTSMTAEVTDLQGVLRRDVEDATNISLASAQNLTLSTVRDGNCNIRAYDLTGASWTITTTYFAQERCAGPSETRADKIVHDLGKDGHTVPSATKLSYFNADGKVIAADPVTDLRRIKRVEWKLSVLLAGQTTVKATESGAAYNGFGDASGTGTQSLQGRAPLLAVTTDVAPNAKVVGIDSPILGWTDTTPTVTRSFTVKRSTVVEAGSVATWTDVASGLSASTSTWTDATALPGYAYVYVVLATLTDSTTGPSSNQVVTGLAPSAPTGVAATGQPTSIRVAWNKSVGANAYDIYADSKLVGRVGDVTTYTYKPGEQNWTGPGYGHAHNFVVVGVNRWERQLMTGSSTGAVPFDADSTATLYAKGSGVGTGKRQLSGQAGAFTAPAAPVLTVAPNSSWGYQLSWAPAPWVGSGPTAGRDRSWLADVNGSTSATPSGSWAPLWSGVEQTVPSRTLSYTQTQTGGLYRTYRAVTVNPSGSSPATQAAASAQRPVTPTCSTSVATTRAMNVTVTPGAPATVPNVAYRVDGGIGTPVGGGASTSTVKTIDQLTHSTSHTFTVYTQNGSTAGGGWSDGATCSGTTAVLDVSVSASPASTRSVNASLAPTNGTNRSLRVVRNYNWTVLQSIGGTGGTFDPLYDGEAYTVVGHNDDGWNTVEKNAGATTPTLATPGAPSCSISVDDGTAPGAITVTGGYQVRLDGGTAYGNPRQFTGLGVGSHTGQARNRNSDGFNSADSGWANCGTGNIGYAIAAPGCATTAVNFGSGPGARLTALTYCRVDGATHYEARLQTERSSDGSLSGWGSDEGWDPSPGPYDDGGGLHVVAGPVGIAQSVVSRVQWRVRAIFDGGPSSWVTTPWADVT